MYPLRRGGKNLTGINPQDNQPVCPDCKTFDVSHWVASVNRKNGPRRLPSHETFSVASQGELDISSVVGQAPSLVRLHNSSSGLVAESTKCSQRCRSPPPRTQRSSVYRRLRRRLGRSLKSRFYQRTVVTHLEKSLHINVLELKAVFLALKHFSLQCQNQTVLVATDKSTVVAYINKQGGTHSVEMCALLWRIMSGCHRFKISLCARHIPGCLNVIADSLSRSTQIQSTEWSLHPRVFKRICTKWFTPQVDLFVTWLNHKLPLYVSPVPDQNAWNIDALNISWSSLVAYAYPPTALLPKVIQKVRQYNCLLILIAPGWPGMPWFWDLVHLSVEIPLQLPASPNLLKQSSNQVFHNNPQPQPPCLVSRSEQLQEQAFSSEVAGRIAAPQRSSTRSIYQAKWVLFEKWCRENLVDVSKPSIKQISRLLYAPISRLK